MTIQNPPIFIQAGSHPAEDVRRWMGSIVPTPGVLDATEFIVAEAGTPDMTVDVSGGSVYINGDEATYQGIYFAENRGSTNLAVAASDPTNPRIDLVVARIKDSAYSGASDTFSLEVVTGTPAASPVTPTTPDNSLLLATISVVALASAITDAVITDTRVIARTRNELGLVFADAAARDAGVLNPSEGMTSYLLDVDSLSFYDGSAWVEFHSNDSYRFNRRIAYSTSSTFNKASYPNLRAVRVHVVGGGGGGGGVEATAALEGAASSGGGAGCYAMKLVTDIAGLAASETLTVGSSGPGGLVGGDGGTGGTTIALGISASGGLGSLGDLATPGDYLVSLGALGGSTFTGSPDFARSGDNSQVTTGQTQRSAGGTGAPSEYGRGGLGGNAVTAAGGNGNGGYRGGGGGGAANSPSQTAKTGGSGGSGYIVLELFS